jgi:Tfp pilus assembly protein FimT
MILDFGFKNLSANQKGEAGFSLIEILVVMGMLTIIGALGLFMSMDSYRSYAFRNERNIVVSALQRARSQAVSNVCMGATCTDGKPHGVHVVTGQYVIFQGASYATRDAGYDQVINANTPNVSISGLSEVVFAQLSGEVATPGSITVGDNVGHSSVITINSVGQVVWSN